MNKRSNKIFLWLIIITAFVILVVTISRAFNQFSFLVIANKDEEKEEKVVSTSQNTASEYVYLKDKSAIEKSLLSKQEQKNQLNINRFESKNTSDIYVTGISLINIFNKNLKYPISKNVINSMLDEKFKVDKKINDEILDGFAGEYTFIPYGICELIQENNLNKYLFYGYRVNEIEKTAEDYGYILTLNYSSSAFSIAPYNFNELKDVVSKEDGYTNNAVSLNEYNNINSVNDTPERDCNELFKLFKYNAIYNYELAFDELEAEYSKKFGSSKAFFTYAESNQSKLESIQIESSTYKKNNEIITYTCIDQNKNSFYIITKEKDFFDFKIQFSNIIF